MIRVLVDTEVGGSPVGWRLEHANATKLSWENGTLTLLGASGRPLGGARGVIWFQQVDEFPAPPAL